MEATASPPASAPGAPGSAPAPTDGEGPAAAGDCSEILGATATILLRLATVVVVAAAEEVPGSASVPAPPAADAAEARSGDSAATRPDSVPWDRIGRASAGRPARLRAPARRASDAGCARSTRLPSVGLRPSESAGLPEPTSGGFWLSPRLSARALASLATGLSSPASVDATPERAAAPVAAMAEADFREKGERSARARSENDGHPEPRPRWVVSLSWPSPPTRGPFAT